MHFLYYIILIHFSLLVIILYKNGLIFFTFVQLIPNGNAVHLIFFVKLLSTQAPSQSMYPNVFKSSITFIYVICLHYSMSRALRLFLINVFTWFSSVAVGRQNVLGFPLMKTPLSFCTIPINSTYLFYCLNSVSSFWQIRTHQMIKMHFIFLRFSFLKY